MRVLLIGKFPPCQGGVSSKYWWLYQHLAKEFSFSFKIVTMTCQEYVTPCSQLSSNIDVDVLKTNSKTKPWFIPNTDLAIERLVSAAIISAKDFHPQVIESNYLAPFGIAAWIVSRILGIPLILRTAGSDLGKLLKWPETQNILRIIMKDANALLMPQDKCSEFTKDPDIHPTTCTRYIPCPDIFRSMPTNLATEGNTMLVLGKINYYWKLKAFDTLVKAIEHLPNWRVLFVVGGRETDNFKQWIKDKLPQEQYNFTSFIHPCSVPKVLHSITSVWCVTRDNDVSDFSNTVAEAIATQRPCILSQTHSTHPETKLWEGSQLIKTIDPDDYNGVTRLLRNMPSKHLPIEFNVFKKAFNKYIEENRSVYERFS